VKIIDDLFLVGKVGYSSKRSTDKSPFGEGGENLVPQQGRKSWLAKPSS
jgi:hypothetical protein